MKRSITLIALIASCLASAGQPLHDVLQLRTIEVLRCEVVTDDNVAEVSRFLREPSRSDGIQPVPSAFVDGVPGFLVEGILKRHRDVAFPNMGGGDPVKDPGWAGADGLDPLTFFVPGGEPDACDGFVPGERVSVVLSQRAECDTYPPEGICAFDRPIRLVDPETWAMYGE